MIKQIRICKHCYKEITCVLGRYFGLWETIDGNWIEKNAHAVIHKPMSNLEYLEWKYEENKRKTL